MDKLDNIDDLFSKLGSDEKPAPAGVWEYILADQKRKRRAGALWWYYGTVGLLLVAGLGGYYQSGRDKKPMPTSTITQSASENNHQIVNNAIATNNAPLVSSIAVGTSYSNPTSSNPPILPTAYGDYIKKEKYIIGQKNEEQHSTKVGDIIQPKEAVLNDGTKGSAEETASIDLSPKTTRPVDYKKDKTIRKDPKTEDPKYFVEATISYTNSYRKLTGDANMANHISQRNSSEVHLIKPAVAFTVGKELNKQWNMQAGFIYNVQGLSASYTVSAAQKRVYVGIDPTFKKYDTTANAYIYIKDSVYKLEKGNSINGDQKYHYIRVPILIEGKTNFIKHSILFYSGGLSINYLLAARGDVQDYQSTQSGVFIPVSQVKLNHVGLDIMTRVGVLMPIFGKPDLKWSISFRGMYSPTSVFGKEVPLKQHNYSMAVEVGIRKIFK